MKYIGKIIAGYKIKRQIGIGGMGTIYFAEAALLADSPPVAIKVLHRKLSQDEDIRERFKREAKLQYKLDHPNIVKLNQYLEEGEDCFIIMEYFPSKSLSEIIGKTVGPMPHERGVPIFRQVLAGIKSAHDKGIIHRDIKPSNILLDDNDQVKITDFGVAKEEGVGSLTKTGVVIGSVPYMSPAQVKGNSRHVNKYSDIYSLGITFYEMLAGRTPFEGGDFDVMNAHVNKTPKPPTVHYPHIPEHLVDVVLKSLSKKQSDRYKSCDEFSDALEKPKIIAPQPQHVWSNFEKFALTSFVGLLVIAFGIWTDTTDTTVIIDNTDFVPEYSIILDQPNGSEVWETGQTKTIKWRSKNISRIDDVYIDLYKFGGFLQRVAYATPNDGKYNWKIGDEIHESGYYKMKIYHDKTNVSDFTDKTFTIKKPRKNDPPSPTISAEEYYKKGINAYNKDNYDEAIEYFDFAIKKKANYYDARLYRGWSHYMLNNAIDASIDAVYNINSRGNAEDYYLEGVIKISQKEFNSAISYLNTAIKKKNNNGQYYYWRGLANWNLKKHSSAENDFTDCIKLNSKSFDCFQARGLVRYERKNYQQALSDIGNAIKIRNSDPYLFYMRAVIFKELGNISNACKDLKSADNMGHSDAKRLIDQYGCY